MWFFQNPLLAKEFNDLDAAYESSKQVRAGNRLMGYSPQITAANKNL
jgi:hypothetical protein